MRYSLFTGSGAESEVLFNDEGPITVEAGKVMGSVEVYDEMHFSMDVTINSIPTDGATHVLLCGNSDLDRNPTIFLTTSSQFLVKLSDGSWHWSGDVAAGKTYHLDVDYTQNWWTLRVDEVIVSSASKSTHTSGGTKSLWTTFTHDPVCTTC